MLNPLSTSKSPDEALSGFGSVRILAFDFGGYPFPAQLSRELSRRGHDVVHSWCAAYVGGHGRLEASAGERVRFEPISVGRGFTKTNYLRRLYQELVLGVDLLRHIRRIKPQVVVVANTLIPMLVLLAAYLRVRRIPWVLWHQDVHSVALRRMAGTKLSKVFSAASAVYAWGERWGARQAAAIVVITQAFRDVHERWGTADKVSVIPNWAPTDEIVPRSRDNPWAADHDLQDGVNLLYAGTLGLKHNPELLAALAAEVRHQGLDARLVVVNEGPCVPIVAAKAEELDVPTTLLPFQDYEDLPDVLGTGDVLIVLLEEDAGAFSVPSKALSCLSAGRPVIGLMPANNDAAVLLERAGCRVLPPSNDSIPAAATWVREVMQDRDRWNRIGRRARALAESEFALDGCVDRFEQVIRTGVGTRPR